MSSAVHPEHPLCVLGPAWTAARTLGKPVVHSKPIQDGLCGAGGVLALP